MPSSLQILSIFLNVCVMFIPLLFFILVARLTTMSKNVVTNQKNQAFQQEVERKRLLPIYETIGTHYNFFYPVKLVNDLHTSRYRKLQAGAKINQHPSQKTSRFSARQSKQKNKKLQSATLTGIPLPQCCKALILEKMGELEEAYAICKEVQAEKPTDPSVLNSLRAVFKSLGKCTTYLPLIRKRWVINNFFSVHDNTILCETALAADPKNKALARSLFFSWVKEVDFKNQQQVSAIRDKV